MESTIGTSVAMPTTCMDAQPISPRFEVLVKLSGTPKIPVTLNKRVCGNGEQLQRKQALSMVGLVDFTLNLLYL